MATNGDSITGGDEVNVPTSTELTVGKNSRPILSVSHEEKIEAFLRRVLPVVSDNATHPAQALVPWVCDVLQSKQSLEVYGQDIRDFTAHMERFGVGPLEVKADHLKLYKAALRDAGLSGATIARKLSVLRGMYHQFAVKKLVSWEIAQDIAAVESPKVQKNTTPALTEKQAVLLLHAPDTATLRGLRDRALLHTLFITACRVSAMTNAKVGHLEFDGIEWFLHVTEKRNKKQRKILLEAARSITSYMDAAGIADDREGPLFRRFSPDGRSLLPFPLCRESVWRIVKSIAGKPGFPRNASADAGLASTAFEKLPSTTRYRTVPNCTRHANWLDTPTCGRPSCILFGRKKMQSELQGASPFDELHKSLLHRFYASPSQSVLRPPRNVPPIHCSTMPVPCHIEKPNSQQQSMQTQRRELAPHRTRH